MSRTVDLLYKCKLVFKDIKKPAWKRAFGSLVISRGK